MSDPHRILFVATTDWFGYERLPMLLREAGFSTACLKLADTVLDALEWDTAFRWVEKLGLAGSMQAAIDSYEPDLLVFLDEMAIQTASKLICAKPGPLVERNRALLERSLGRLESFPARVQRRSLVSFQGKAGFLPTLASQSIPQMLDFGAAQNWRCIFKLESSSAGLGVRKSADENSFRRVAALMIAQKVPFIVQRFVTGKSNERAAAALNGDVLCGISFEKVQIAYEFGYATVVQPVCNAAMAEFTAVIARSFGLSGFFGCDFVIEEETGRPWLVEVNARPITWHHLAFKCGVDFAEAVHQIIEGRGAPQQDAVIDSRPVALFPKELQRDPQSPWLQKAVHDVPKNHPRLLAYYKERLARESQRKA